MTITHQNNYSCYLSCLESFFADVGKTITWQTIIDDFPIESHKGQLNEGEFDFTEINNAKLQERYRFTISDFRWVNDSNSFNHLRSGDFIRAFNMKDQNTDHVVRFFEYANEDCIRVMDPKLGGFDCWTRDEFLSYKCYAFNVSL